MKLSGRSLDRIAVIGFGQMGRGISQLFASKGKSVCNDFQALKLMLMMQIKKL